MSSGPGDEYTVVAPPTVDERPREDRAEPTPGTLVSQRYEMLRRIGKGGMGEVMAARDEQVGRDVAIKRMKAAAPSARAIARFLREATIQGRLEHPAIVPVHEIGRDPEGLPFFVMKKLTGTTLARILDSDRARFPLERILRAFAEVCLAVEFAHVKGVVHRDLKPDNIILGDYGEVYVLDWGVAKVIGEDDGEFADVDSSSGEHATRAGTAIGTPGYMSPEQASGREEVDGRSDVYTLGCVLFEILAAEPLHPRGHDGLRSALAGVDARPSVRSPERKTPPELEAICVAATQLDRNARPTARELGDRVQRFLDGDRDLALRRELAQSHLERAHKAFAAGDREDDRRAAMREAAAALALDPALDGAAALVGRLMLEPPRSTPREVDEAVYADDVRMARANARFGIWALIATVGFTPALLWISPGFSTYLGLFVALIAVNFAVCIHAFTAKTPKPGLVVLGNAVLLVVIARMFSPVLIAPGVAAVLAMAMVMTPRFTWLGSTVGIAALNIIAVLSPFILERLDVISRTMWVSEDGVRFQSPVLGGHEGPTMVVAMLYIAFLIALACAMGGAMRARARVANRHLHLQAWQLRQLVPA